MLETVELLEILSRGRPTSLTGRISRSGASTGRSRRLENVLAPGLRCAYIRLCTLRR